MRRPSYFNTVSQFIVLVAVILFGVAGVCVSIVDVTNLDPIPRLLFRTSHYDHWHLPSKAPCSPLRQVKLPNTEGVALAFHCHQNKCPVTAKALEKSMLVVCTMRSLLVKAWLTTAIVFTDLGSALLQNIRMLFICQIQSMSFFNELVFLLIYILWPLQILCLLN